MNTRKHRYKRICNEESSIPIFSRDWWLDATAGSNNWDVAPVEEQDHVLTCMPLSAKEDGMPQRIDDSAADILYWTMDTSRQRQAHTLLYRLKNPIEARWHSSVREVGDESTEVKR